MREFTDRTRGHLRNAQAELVELVGASKAMDLTGKSKSVVYRWRDDISSDLMALPEVLTLEAHARRPLITQVMARFHGSDMTHVAADPVQGSLSLHVAEIVEFAGRLVVETAKAKSDGVVTRAEAARLLDLLAGLERIVPAIKDMLVGVQVEGPLHVGKGDA
jgi:hypothetical protein